MIFRSFYWIKNNIQSCEKYSNKMHFYVIFSIFHSNFRLWENICRDISAQLLFISTFFFWQTHFEAGALTNDFCGRVCAFCCCVYIVHMCMVCGVNSFSRYIFSKQAIYCCCCCCDTSNAFQSQPAQTNENV